jgi:single-strand DNA-binding protein
MVGSSAVYRIITLLVR